MKPMIFIAVLLFLADISFAQNLVIEQYNITFAVGEDFVRETIRLEIESPAERMRFISRGVYDINARNSQGVIGFSVRQEGGFSVIEVFPKNDTFVEISFSSRDQIIRSDNTYQFFIELAIGLSVKALHADLILPPGFVVDSFYPQENSIIRSDGRNIIISWDFENPKSVPLFVRYRSTQTAPTLFIIPMIVLAAIGGFGLFHYRKRAKDEFLKGLFEDERKVVAYLIRHKVAYQNRVEKEFQFSRPKMTRIVYKLEQRGWVKKERRGRTNKLTWVKGTPEEKKIARRFEERQKKQKQKEQVERLMGQTEQI